ncbi:MAG: hypothetical protein GTO17_01490 [Candidatus Aminicenantes bacterium]|nr:hypothetical protein [Candidatus Aminicenantes bacterium]
MLRWGVIASFLICIISLIIMVLKTLSFGRKPVYAKSQGKGIRGILYAFGKGMMPWEKESTRRHILTYTGGTLYHGGIFAAFFCLFSLVMSFELSIPLKFLCSILIGLGFLSGVGLLVKRILLIPLRKISCVDDFAANLAVDVFLALALLNIFYPGLETFFYGASIILFLYIPAGKVRHCVFFFYARILFGLFYGRRGVLPRKIRFET